ncbi:extracellular solute-binding protein [Buchananella hordeovulneris]|uniref:ABC transporter substrate-binding protein n=1 Tax=Buchananella hordeovulneris TaxID=52770 RepID=A0A1Q5PY61_9ACTO|nr:extracellular solute-binding protein [Buchananella hordeovulneris]OKL52375.1 ABC transporter substrate-binding protein [Buchananella hordeovulneris]RRD53803.1 extracellular solute-binding protein [Buchananella hordeovulneris]
MTTSLGRPRLAALLAGATALSMLASCGQSSAANVGDAVKDEKADKGLPIVGETLKYDPNTLVNDGEPIQLQWWAWTNIELFQQIADEYQQIHPNVDIQVVNQPWDDIWTKLPLELKGSNGPALFNVHGSQHDNLIQFMAPYDIPLDDARADYTGVDYHVIDGQVHYLDLGLMSGAIYYNTDMWAKAGLTDADIPQTWDEFREVAKKLTIREGDKIVQAGFSFNEGGQNFQMGMAYQLGQNLFAADGQTPTINNEANLKVIERFLEIYADGSGSKDFGTSGTDSFGQGQVAMTYAWGWFSGQLQNDFPDIKWSAFPTPVPEKGKVPYAYDRTGLEATFGINKNASPAQQAVAQDFLLFYLTNAQAQKDLAMAYSVFPSYKPIANDPIFQTNPAIVAFHDVDRYIWPGNFPATFENSLSTMWQDILYNGVSPKDALAAAEERIKQDLANLNFTSSENVYPHYDNK